MLSFITVVFVHLDSDGIDDDGDGRIDEDCCGTPPMNPLQKPLSHLKICSGHSINFSCRDRERIKIVSAHYGRLGSAGELSCNHSNPIDEYGFEIRCPYESVKSTIAVKCDNQANCSLTASEQLLSSKCFANSKCPPSLFYLEIFWTCLCKIQFSIFKFEFKNRFFPVTAEMNCAKSMTHVYSASSYLGSEKSDSPSCKNAAFQSNHYLFDDDDNNLLSEERPTAFNRYAPEYGRLSAPGGRIWCASSCDTKRPFVQIDIGGHFLVKGVIIQRHRLIDNRVVEFALQRSFDGVVWKTIFDPSNGTTKIFEAITENYNGTVLWWDLGGWAFIARYIRVYVMNFVGHPCMNVDIVHCAQAFTCPSLPIENAQEFGVIGVPGSRIDVHCNHQFVTPNYDREFTVECSEKGSWQLPPDQAKCSVALNCGDVVQVPNAVYDTRSNKVGFTTRYFCSQGSVLIGKSVSTCQQNGQWTQPPLCCGTDELVPGISETCIQMSSEQLNYFDAVQHCQRRGGRLAEPRNLLEMSIVTKIVGKKGKSAWIGYSDLMTEGSWRTESTGSFATIDLRWATDSPNGFGNENCAIVNASAVGNLDDANCYEKFNFFCFISYNETINVNSIIDSPLSSSVSSDLYIVQKSENVF